MWYLQIKTGHLVPRWVPQIQLTPFSRGGVAGNLTLRRMERRRGGGVCWAQPETQDDPWEALGTLATRSSASRPNISPWHMLPISTTLLHLIMGVKNILDSVQINDQWWPGVPGWPSQDTSSGCQTHVRAQKTPFLPPSFQRFGLSSRWYISKWLPVKFYLKQ